MQMVEKRERSGHIMWYNPDIFPDCSSAVFEPSYWQQHNAITGSAEGRGTTLFLHYQGHDLVLRHYRRGGLIGKWVDDSYFFTGFSRTRAWQELILLSKMKALGLPCPTPVAAGVTRVGPFYSADIISQKIANAQDTHNLLLRESLTQQIWQKIGQTISQFHNAQVYHHDLNIHNIMLDTSDKVWLIDFDKCTFKSGNNWKVDNINRLQRSLNKEQSKYSDYHFSPRNWEWLLAGYYA